MSILINENTKLIVQGITGREGKFHARLMKEYGTRVVAGVTPGKGGKEVSGIPVYDTVREAQMETGANSSILFVPPRYTKDAIIEAVSAGLDLVVAVAEGVPFQDMLYCYNYARYHDCVLIGPNTPGVISPGKSKVGFMSGSIYKQGKVGVMSRSATLSYETSNNLSNREIGQSTVVGIGGDPIQGSSFIDLLPLYEKDDQTEVIVLLGEIGGRDEEKAAEYIDKNMNKKAIALIAGEAAPEGKRMGHAGAIVSPGGEGGAGHKKKVLAEAGIKIAEDLTDIPDLVQNML